LNNFDNFYGVDNFSGFHNSFSNDNSESIVCQDQSVEIVQQQLAVLREYAKRVIVEVIFP